jgi:tRNA A-37 threonylcarbamoyl transferase component Bud32
MAPFDHVDPVADLLEPYARDEGALLGPGWRTRVAPNQPWLSFQRPDDAGPEQGWKLHVSSTVNAAATVLARALPVLVSERVPFKVASSRSALGSINDGSGGLSQVGKFITIYPVSDAQAVALAVALDAQTRGLAGPRIPSDQPLGPGSLVHYRYGAFGTRMLQQPWGEALSALQTPDGGSVPDVRETEFRKPEWVDDPFVAAGVAEPIPPTEDRFGGRYLLMGRLSQSTRGSVFLAVDVVSPRRCVVKEALRHALVDRSGADACDRLRNEASMLRRVGDDPRFPTLLDVVETAGGLALVMEDLPGATLDEVVHGHAKQGRFIPIDELLRGSIDIAQMLGSLHAEGIVFRDLKAANVMVSPDGSLRLFDFELAQPVASATVPGIGTRGYMSPQQVVGEQPCLADDIYGFGGVLWLMATAIEPGKVPGYGEHVASSIEAIQPGLPDRLLRLASRCLAHEPAERPPSMAAIAAELREIAPHRRTVEVAGLEPDALERLRALARRVGDSLCRLALPVPGDDGLMWRSPVGPGKISFHRDVNCGTAGVVLALSDVVQAFGDAHHREVLARAAGWLRRAPRPPAATCTGLYVGEAGVGAALLRAGLVLEDDELLAAAAERSRWVAEQPLDSPDLFNGAAGRLRFHLAVASVLERDEHLATARAVGQWLLRAATPAEHGGHLWRIPAGFGSMSGTAMPGYAHGAAGIADALLDLFEVTDDADMLDGARGAAQWLERSAIPALDDDSGVDWPVDEASTTADRIGPFWCHGAAGIARFMARAAAVGLTPSAMDLAERAALTAGRGGRWSAVCQCHGLLGNIESLIDVHQATGDARLLREARPLVDLVVSYAMEVDGALVWPFDSPSTHTPDLMVGFSGVAPCLLRVVEAEHRPHLLSLRGLTMSSSHGASHP